MNKAFWSHFEHFGREIAVKNLSFPHSQKDWWRVPSQQPTTWLTGKLPASRHMSRHYWPVWVWSYGKIQPFSGGGGRGVDRKLGVTKVRNSPLQWVGWGVEGERGFWQIANSSYSRHQIHQVELAQTPWIVYFPATLSFQKSALQNSVCLLKDILFFPNLPACKNLSEEQIFWGTDSLGAPAITVDKFHCSWLAR